MSDLIERDKAIAMFEKELQATEEREECTVSREYAIGFEGVKRILTAVPSAQPETANIIVGKSRDGMTMWYQCDNCNEPVDENDLYCRRCGRRFING